MATAIVESTDYGRLSRLIAKERPVRRATRNSTWHWHFSCRLPAVRRQGVSLALVCVFVSACGSSSTTSITAPTTLKCAVAASTSPTSFPFAGGSGSLTITTNRECSWGVASESSWILPDRTSGQGEATVPFRVAPNGTPNARRGTLVLESTRLEVAQEGAPCRFDLNANRIEIGASGGVGRIQVTTMAECGWSARALDAWITVARGVSGSGTDQVELLVAANSGPVRQGSVTIAGQTVTIAQEEHRLPRHPRRVRLRRRPLHLRVAESNWMARSRR